MRVKKNSEQQVQIEKWFAQKMAEDAEIRRIREERTQALLKALLQDWSSEEKHEQR